MSRDLALTSLSGAENIPGEAERRLEFLLTKDPGLSARDRALAVHLVQGVLRWQIRLDWILKKFVRFPFGKIDAEVLNILRLALYQILFLDRVPDSAAVNEAVKQVRKRKAGANHVVKFVNGILRQICREKTALSYPHPEKERDLYRSVFYAYPLWLVKKWNRELGPDATLQLLKAGNQIPRLIIRANTLRNSRQSLLERFKRDGIAARTASFAPQGIELPYFKGSVANLDAFREGLFQVQGEAAQICGHLLAPEQNRLVLDVCSGLGGKSTHMAELIKDCGRILSLDTSIPRLKGLMENTRRLGIKSVLPLAADAERPLSFFREPIHKIMVDGPCSGLGVISKHPDTKLSKKEDDIKRLAMVQNAILKRSFEALGSGGELLYVTCTISEAENETLVERILKDQSNIVLADLRQRISPWGEALTDDNGFLKTLPHIHGMEGFFAALFQKK